MGTEAKYTVDIDSGGTMTDCLIAGGGALHALKLDTTPHDFTVSFLDCLKEGAKRLGFADVRAFLDEVALIRWSSTITSNLLAERRGPKIGCLVSEGHERDLYGKGASPAVDSIIAGKNVIGLDANPAAEAILAAVRRLLEEGVRRICVSLGGAFPANAAELQVKQTIESQFPDHTLGAVPVLLGSEMAETPNDQTRTHYSLINAYTHTGLASSLFKAEDLLQYDHRFKGPLLIGHTNGGVARVGKTKAADTIESGPVFGTFAGAFFARRYGLGTVACVDVGGTTAKASVIRDGKPVYRPSAEFLGIPVATTLPLLHSAAIGGGSVARADGKSGVTLGPESMGAAPGPACYGLGGSEATLTDVFLALGYLDAERFLGGRRKLDRAAARSAVERAIGGPLKLSVARAAERVKDRAIQMVAALVGETVADAGVKADALFAYGGNGPLFAPFLAERMEIATAYVFFDLGPVFSAFGSEISDVVHLYSTTISSPGEREAAIQRLRGRAARDLRGEGFDPGRAEMTIESDPGNEGTVRLRVVYPIASTEPQNPGRRSRDVARAKIGERTIVLDGNDARAAVYEAEQLAPGHRLGGPVVVVAGSTTLVVPPLWKLEIDELGNGVLRR